MERRKRKAIRNIRSHLAFFGHDMSHLTDEELEERVKAAHKVIGSAGITMAEGSERLRALRERHQAKRKGV